MFGLERKAKVALLSILSNTCLIVLKVTAGILSGSVSIMSEAIHSAVDLVASVIAFISVRNSSKPADKEHPYGHGKLENISGAVEGLLIFVAAGMIIFESTQKLVHPEPMEYAFIAVSVMFISALINFLVSRKLYRVAKEEGSMALEADALHLKTDVYTALGVGAGLLLIELTGFLVLDPVVAIFVALLIIKEAWSLCKSAFEHLLDGRLSEAEEETIDQVIKNAMLEYPEKLMDYHKLKTRRSGNKRHIDFHITLHPDLTVREAHDIVGFLKKSMNEKFMHTTRVNIHIDPYQKNEQ